MIAPKALPRAPARSLERVRTATRRRARRAQRRGYAAFAQVLGVVAFIAIPVMVYVMLTANLTSLNYSLAKAERQKAQMQEASLRLDDRIAHLESRERLAAMAALLKMHDPHIYAVVELPSLQPKPAPHGIAFLGAVNNWFKTP
ncbi:MAG: hypothetical protein NVSMB64_25440 [Candidatus Velthaea sp.]